MSTFSLAVQDVKQSISRYPVWLNLGALEVKQRYRRSVLGPWWITIGMFVFILCMGQVFSRLLKQNMSDYLPFFTTGFLVWSFISSTINESTEVFKHSSGFIKQVKLPYNIYMLKFLVRNLIILAHNFVVYLIVMCFFKINPGWNSLFALLGLGLLTINMYWMALLIAITSLRFRDFVPIINTMVQLLFFITPISWSAGLLKDYPTIVKINPFCYLLDIVRKPLLGTLPSTTDWLIAILLAVIGLSITMSIFSSIRSRLPFWID